MLLWLFLFSFSSSYGFEIKKVKGDVDILRGESSFKAEKKMVLQNGDVIQTHRRSRVKIFDGGHNIWLGQKTRFVVKERSSGKAPGTVSLVYGKFRSQVNKEKNSKYRYKLSTAVAGVRGTEFFAQTDESGDTLCTLEGVVGATLESGEVIEVPQGKGLRLKVGHAAALSDNSPFLVDQWVSATAFDEESRATFDRYGLEKKEHKTSNKWAFGGYGWLHLCDTSNGDFDSNVSDKNNTCARTYLTGHLRYGKEDSFFVRPAINGFWKNETAVVDTAPLVKDDNKTVATLAEAYFQMIRKKWQIKAGQQGIEWAGGEILSLRNWSPEPMTHLGLSAQASLSSWGIGVFASKGNESSSVIDGYSQVSFLGLKVTFPKNWLEAYLLTSTFENKGTSDLRLHRDRETSHYGVFSERKWTNRLESKVSLVGQSHLKLPLADGSSASRSGQFADVELGWNFQRWKLQLRWLSTSGDFIGVHEDWYELGASGFFQKRINIQQTRLGLQWAFNENRSLSSEIISSSKVKDSDFFTYGRYGTEWDILFHEKWGRFQLDVGGWLFQPEKRATANDLAMGLIARLQFVY